MFVELMRLSMTSMLCFFQSHLMTSWVFVKRFTFTHRSFRARERERAGETGNIIIVVRLLVVIIIIVRLLFTCLYEERKRRASERRHAKRML